MRIYTNNPIIDAFLGGPRIWLWDEQRSPELWLWPTWWRRRFNRVVLETMLGGEVLPPRDNSTHLPSVEFTHTAWENVGDVAFKWVLFPSGKGAATKAALRRRYNTRNTAAHRVFIECPCGRLVPVGRVHMHVCGDRK